MRQQWVNGGVRTRFHADLEQLTAVLARMCAHDRAAVTAATEALLHADVEQAERVIDLSQELDDMGQECEQTALTLLALQSPVAGELRQVVAALQLAAHLARMGDLAEHIAEIARRRHPDLAVPARVRPIVARLGAAAAEMARAAGEAVLTGDRGIAARLEAEDEIVDGLHRELLAAMLAPGWDGGNVAVVDLTLVGRFYERFADHAVDVARRTEYVVTGVAAGS